MRILCLNPAPMREKVNPNMLLIKEGRCMERSGAWSNLRMPLTLAYISSILKGNGYEVKLVDEIAMQYLGTPTDMEQMLMSFQPDIIILNTAVPTALGEDMDNANLAKQLLPKCKTIMIGVAPTIIFEHILKEGFIDVCIRNEPELTSLELCNAFRDNRSIANIMGISFMHEGKIVSNQDAPMIMNLDSLPFPDYEALPLDAYQTPVDRHKQVLVESSRGCPHQCIYCTGTLFYGRTFRHRDPKKICDEMEYTHKFGVKKVFFWADTFTYSKDFVMNLSDEILQRGLEQDMSWIVNSRVDRVTPEILNKMDDAGCFLIAFGVESGVQKILNYIKKGITLEQSRNAFKWIRDTNILSASQVVFGLAPFENANTIKQTIRFVKELKPNYANFHIATPYPGTEMYQVYSEKGYISDFDPRKLESVFSNISLPELSYEELKRWRDKAFYDFFLTPRVMLQELKKLKSTKEFVNLIDNGLWFIQGWAIAKMRK